MCGTSWHGWYVPEPEAKGVVNLCHCSQDSDDQHRRILILTTKIPEEPKP